MLNTWLLANMLRAWFNIITTSEGENCGAYDVVVGNSAILNVYVYIT